jgi:hypothetical protein
MKKLACALVVLLATAPAWADVNISASAAGDPCDANQAIITISYSEDEVGQVRAFALDITLEGEANVVAVDCVNGDYYIYPGSIDIASDGTINSWGSCLCSSSYAGTLPGLDSNGVTVEMGSLYEEGEPAPADANTLVVLTINGCGDVNVLLAENVIRGGVVMEDPDASPTVNLTGTSTTLPDCPTGKCLVVGQTVGGNLITQAMYDLWVSLGEPASWCYDCHSLGDTNGDCFVDAVDVQLFVAAWSVYDADADTNNDGTIDAVDVQALLNGWNNGCPVGCTPAP